MSKNISTTNETFIIKWKVENFHFPIGNNPNMISPIVTLNSFFSTKWVLKVFEDFDGDYVSESIQLSLNRIDIDDGPMKVDIEFTLIVNSVSSEKNKISFTKGESSYITFQKEVFYALNNTVEIQCCMRMSDGSSASVKENLELVSADSKQSKEVNLPLENISPNFNQCYIHSTMEVLQSSFTCSIDDFDIKNSRIPLLPVLNFNDTYHMIPMIQLMNSKDDTCYLQVKFCFSEKSVLKIFAICLIHILGSDGKIYKSFRDYFYFVGDKNNMWQFCHKIKWSCLKIQNSKYLRFEIALSDGTVQSEIDFSINVTNCLSLYKPDSSGNIFQKELFRFYNEKKFCDITLRTEDESFECHKTVLCAMSPVFEAMFESGMQESSTNIVQIDDLDANTVRQMLHYMYTQKLLSFELKNVMNLFPAANKYQIDSLMQVCDNFLERNLNHENVCEILDFADSRNAAMLKKSAIGYISTYRNEILYSLPWKKLADKNLHLAYEILLEIAPYD